MHVNVSSVTLETLRAFRRRRTRLIVLRGVCATLVTLVVAMAVVALLDYLFVLPDKLRWALSGTGYALVLVVAWMSCLKWLLRMPSDRQLARLVEATRPELREDLLSAIELGTPVTGEEIDSPVFRQLLQQSVATRVTGLRADQLLPWRLVGGWLIATATLMLAMILLWTIPGTPFRALLTRAYLPVANVTRLSQVRVTILAPTPHDATVPQNESLPLVVELAGPDVEVVKAESRSLTGETQVVTLQRQADARHSGRLDVGTEPFDYRVLAGDAVTQYYRVTPRPRPYIATFTKTYHYPSYAKQADATLKEPHGHLQALEGTVAELTLHSTQPVQSGTLEIVTGQSREKFPLAVSAPDTLTGRVPMKIAGTYTVHVVAADTQFANRLSPPYDIKVVPDQVPQIQLTAPADRGLFGPQDVVIVQGEATDDLGLATIVQEVRVNERPPIRLPISQPSGKATTIRQPWDLLPLKLSAGDRIVTKLIATDHKGNVGESAAVTASVVSAMFSSARLASLEAQQNIAEELAQLSAAIERQRELSLKSLKQLDTMGLPESQRKLDQSNISQGHEQLPREVDRVLRSVAANMSKVSAGAESNGLLAIGQLLTNLQYQVLNRTASFYDRAATAKAGPERARFSNELAAHYRLATDILSRAVQGTDLFIADESLEIAQDMLHDLARQRSTGTQSGRPAGTTTDERLVRQAGATLQQCVVLEGLIRDAAGKLRDRELTKLMEPLTQQCKALEKALSDPALGKAPDKEIVALDNAIAQTLSVLQPVVERHARTAAATREELTRRSGLLREHVRSVSRPWSDTLLRRRVLSEPPRAPLTPAQLAAARQVAMQAQTQLLDFEAPQVLGRLLARMDLESARRDADWRYVADLGLAYRALMDLLERYAAQDDFSKPDATAAVANVTKLIAALTILDSAHDLSDVVRAERDLTSRERWASQTAAAHTLHPRQWDFVVGRLDVIAPQMRPLGFSREAMELLTAIAQRPSTKTIGERMTTRRKSTAPPPAISDQLSQVDSELYAVLQLMLPQITDARQVLESLAPTPTQMLRQLAVRTHQLQQENVRAAQPSDPQPPLTKHATAASEKLAAVRLKLNIALGALRVEANLQDVLSQQGREFARDVDDAVLMLTKRADAARDALAAVRDAEQPAEQRELLVAGAQRELELASALEEAADHLEKLKRGEDVAQSREKLREEEVKHDRRVKLQEREERLAELGRKADLAATDPRRLLAELEQELKQNRVMQGELDDITRQLLRQARADLIQAATQQRQAAAEQARAAESQAAIQSGVMRAGIAVARAARHESRLENGPLAQKVEAIAQDISGAVATELAHVNKRIGQSPQPPTLHSDIEHAAVSIQQQADRIGALLQDPDSADRDGKQAMATSEPADKQPKVRPPATVEPAPETAETSEQAPKKPADQTAAKVVEALKKDRDPETSRWLAKTLDELDESLLAEQEKKKYESLTATAGDKKDEMMPTDPPGEQKPQSPMPPKPMSDEQTEAKEHEDPPMPPSPPGESKADGPGNGNSGTGPGGPPVPGLKPPKGKGKKAKSMFFESTEPLTQEFEQERIDEEEPETKDDPGESLGSGGSAGPAGSRRPHGPLAAVGRDTGVWGKLPPQTARDLSEGSRQELDGDYRRMVESYFRAIAERSKETRKP